MQSLSVQYDHSSRILAEQLANFLQVQAVGDNHFSDTRFILHVQNDNLSLCDTEKPKTRPFTLDFNQPRTAKGKDPLLRAVGPKSKTVLDLTAGWCSDAMHLGRQGFSVTAVEINKLVYSIAAQAHRNIVDNALKSRITMHCVAAAEFLQNLANGFDVVYLDPMYPESSKSSAPPKGLQLLRDIVHNDSFEIDNFNLAMQHARNRVVVKRPHYAPPLVSGKVGEIKSKLVRFDIYKPQGGLSKYGKNFDR